MSKYRRNWWQKLLSLPPIFQSPTSVSNDFKLIKNEDSQRIHPKYNGTTESVPSTRLSCAISISALICWRIFEFFIHSTTTWFLCRQYFTIIWPNISNTIRRRPTIILSRILTRDLRTLRPSLSAQIERSNPLIPNLYHIIVFRDFSRFWCLTYSF